MTRLDALRLFVKRIFESYNSPLSAKVQHAHQYPRGAFRLRVVLVRYPRPSTGISKQNGGVALIQFSSDALTFDDRDREGTAALLAPFANVIGFDDPWQFAIDLARKCFDELLRENGAITTYLGGMPLDSAIMNGVLHPVYRGLGVVFCIGEPPNHGFIAHQVSHIADVAIRPEQIIVAKFWVSAATHMPGRYDHDREATTTS